MLTQLRRDQSGLAAVEFALSMPILIPLIMMGAEVSNMAFTTQKLADLATQTADNISRYTPAITEAQISDTFEGMKLMTDSIDFRNRGRIIVSSVMPIVASNGTITDQQIRWQRCSGKLSVTSSYGASGASLGTTGMGPTGRKVAALSNAELIFVEVRYTYKPLISSAFMGTPTLSALSSVVVRDRSDNVPTTGGTVSSCSTYAA